MTGARCTRLVSRSGGGAVAVPAEEIVSLPTSVAARCALLAVLIDPVRRVRYNRIHRPKRRQDVPAIAKDQAAVPDDFLSVRHAAFPSLRV